jgi:hypothetical protein
MQSLLSECRLTLNEAAKRSGVNPSTTWRWALKGVRGVVLETYALGAKRFTTVEALERFTQRCTVAARGTSAPSPRTPAQRERDIDRAEQELARLGV